MPNIILNFDVDLSSPLNILMYQTQQSIIITAGDGEMHTTISWRIHRVLLMKQAPWIMAMHINQQHRHNHYNKLKKIATKTTERLVNEGRVKTMISLTRMIISISILSRKQFNHLWILKSLLCLHSPCRYNPLVWGNICCKTESKRNQYRTQLWHCSLIFAITLG